MEKGQNKNKIIFDIRMKDDFQKFTWVGMAVCWFGICIDEIMKMI